jgi:uncharacterized membrane protein
VWLQQLRLNALARRISELELQLFSLRDATAAPARPPEETPETAAEAPVAEEEELLLTEVVEEDVLVLDMPLPEASNDDIATEPAPAEKPRMHSPLLLDETVQQDPPAPPRAEPERMAPPPKKMAEPRRLDQWLAEKGLAWIAGIALALGAIYLVTVAVQSGWFTPALRIGAAFALGVATLGVSEWMRRASIARPPGHSLLAALLAGVGVVVLYATVWGALGFEFIDSPVAAALLTLCAAALIGLSFLHGEALGVLAIAMALLTPALTNAPLWPSLALTLYVGAVSASGFALAALRRWSWVTVAAATGLYFWFFQSIAADEVRRALALLSFASFGAITLTWRPSLADEQKARLPWSRLRGYGPAVAICVSSVLLIWAWLIIAPAPSGQIAGPALIAVFHVALASYAVRARAAPPAVLAVAIGGLAIGFMAYLRARFAYGPLGEDFYPTVLIGAFTVTVFAQMAHPHRTGRMLIAASGAIGAALLTMLAASSRGDAWHSVAAWLPLFVGAAVLFVAAWREEATAQNRKADAAIDWWGAGGAALVLLGLESALPGEARALGHASAVLLFAIGLIWRGWRVAGWAALSAAALTLAHALSPSLISPTLAGQLPLWAGLGILFGAAVLLFAASTIIRRSNENIPIAEALSAASVIAALIGVFVALRWVAAGGAGVTLDAFTETSLRVLALMAAGLTLLPRIHEAPGPIGAWRGHVLLGIGLLYAVLVPGLSINPWWGLPGRAVVNGLPILNGLALAFAAPAAFAFAAANRLYTRQRTFARIYAVAGAVLTLLWLVMEIRHSFHNPAMAEPQVGLFESACYGLAFLAFALAVAIVARMRAARNPHRPFTEDLMRAMRGVAWAGLGAAALIMLLAQHPIWGGHISSESNAFSTMLAVLAQAIAMVLALALSRALSVSRDAEPTRFAAASAGALFAWSFGHCVIRWLHHRGYMDDGAPLVVLEGFAHALWPLILVIAAAQLTRLAPGRDTTRAYLYDLQAIWAAAIWPALAYAGLGLWLLYNPWWGAWPAELLTAAGASIAVLSYAAAAALSYVAPEVPHVRWMKYMAPAATILCAVHILIGLTIGVRWLYHPEAMSTAASGQLELWVYSVVWALFGGAALGLGIVRNDPVLRWIGLVALMITILKVFFVDMARLSGVVRAASFLGLGAIAAGMTWFARRNRPPPGPGDLVTVKPSARRERRRVRRRTST